jgi:D-alanine-D-alanine ligase
MDGIKPIALSPLRIAVLLGGTSAERAVSLNSGEAVSVALESRGHLVTRLDPAEKPLDKFDWSQVDVAFIALHGTFGEDGDAQAIFEAAAIPFTGSDSIASRLAFSKSAAKERFVLQEVATPKYLLIHETDSLAKIQSSAGQLGFPLVAKPDAQGSSIGVTMIDSEADLATGVECCFQHQQFGLLERAIVGPEWTVGVIDDNPLPPICIGTDRVFYDYEAKYNADDTRYEFEIETTLKLRLQEIAVKACQVLGTRGVARVDIMLDEQQQPWVLEVNTIPGMTDHSLIPKAAQAIGLDMGQLCELLVDRALNTTRRLRHAS